MVLRLPASAQELRVTPAVQAEDSARIGVALAAVALLVLTVPVETAEAITTRELATAREAEEAAEAQQAQIITAAGMGTVEPTI